MQRVNDPIFGEHVESPNVSVTTTPTDNDNNQNELLHTESIQSIDSGISEDPSFDYVSVNSEESEELEIDASILAVDSDLVLSPTLTADLPTIPQIRFSEETPNSVIRDAEANNIHTQTQTNNNNNNCNLM